MEQIGFQIVLKTVPVGRTLPSDGDDIDDDGDNNNSFVALF